MYISLLSPTRLTSDKMIRMNKVESDIYTYSKEREEMTTMMMMMVMMVMMMRGIICEEKQKESA